MKNIVNSFYVFQDYPEEVKEARRKAEFAMKMRKEEEIHKFPFKKKGFMKRVK